MWAFKQSGRTFLVYLVVFKKMITICDGDADFMVVICTDCRYLDVVFLTPVLLS